MGPICPILNHPLNDGVLVEDEALVKFVQKRNLDFLPTELVCRSCKREITKLYNKKLKKAIELRKSHYHDGSISTLSEHGRVSNNSFTSILQHNGNKTNSIVLNSHSNNASKLDKTPTIANTVSVSQSTSIRLSTSISNKCSILQENQNIQENLKKTIPAETGKYSNVTVRKRTIKDFLTIKPTPQISNTRIATRRDSLVTADSPKVANAEISKTPQIASDDEDVVRRLSQQPTTSNAVLAVASKTAVNSNKRRISNVVDYSDDDECLSLNAFNGTRLPHVQPIPPKRRSVADRAISMARDIMDDYIKDITGG